MTRKDEDRILHGLHYYRETIDEEFTVTSDQILWLSAHSYADAAGWCKDDELQGVNSSIIPAELRRKLLISKFELPLRYLHYRRLIKYSAINEDAVNVAVTFAGADRALRLHTRLGRMELWYQEHRDGFLGVLTTVAVSFITAIVAVLVSERLHRAPIEQARILYEVDPKQAP